MVDLNDTLTTTSTTTIQTPPVTTTVVFTTTTTTATAENPTAPPVTNVAMDPYYYPYYTAQPGPSRVPPLDIHLAPFSYHLPNLPLPKQYIPAYPNEQPAQTSSPSAKQAFTDPTSMSALKSIDTYSGGLDLEAFLDNVATVADCYRWTDSQVVTAIKLKLKGEPQNCFYSLPADKRPTTMKEMREWLVKLFGKKIDFSIAEKDFFKIFRKKDESIQKFALRLEIAAAKLFPASDDKDLTSLRNRIKRETMMIKQFFEGLDTKLANEISRIKHFETVEEALPYAEHCEEVLARLYKETKADAHKAHVRAVTAPQHHAKPTSTPSRPFQKSPPKKNAVLRTDQRYHNMRGRCFNCGSTDHISKKCPKEKQVLCYNCVKVGHRADDKACPLNSKTASTATQRQAV